MASRGHLVIPIAGDRAAQLVAVHSLHARPRANAIDAAIKLRSEVRDERCHRGANDVARTVERRIKSPQLVPPCLRTWCAARSNAEALKVIALAQQLQGIALSFRDERRCNHLSEDDTGAPCLQPKNGYGPNTTPLLDLPTYLPSTLSSYQATWPHSDQPRRLATHACTSKCPYAKQFAFLQVC